MKYSEKWEFIYKGIVCEIVHWGHEKSHPVFKEGIWNAYITIFEKNIPHRFRELLPRSKDWDYYELNDIFNLHEDITYYEVIRNQSTGKIIGVKVGCDYAHSGDMGRSYDEKIVRKELEHSVDTFIKNFPEYNSATPSKLENLLTLRLDWQNTWKRLLKWISGKYSKLEDLWKQ